MLVRVPITEDQARQWVKGFAMQGMLQRMRGNFQMLSSELDLNRDVAIWCNDFLLERCQPYWDVNTSSYSLLFSSQEDVVAFKLRWW